MESPSNAQITIYNGRGLYIESTAGTLWLYAISNGTLVTFMLIILVMHRYGTAVEHQTLYQYQLANTQNIYMGQIQTETPSASPNLLIAINIVL
jgi:glucan 1,3-beta-glucosidase